MRLFFLLSFLLCSIMLHAQLKQVLVKHQQSFTGKHSTSARTEGTKILSAMKLPFWDDFSFNGVKKNYPHDSLWQYGQSVWVNTSMGINPPTLKVATFDGLDSLGLPYNVSTPLSKGVADRLTSRSIRMDLVDPSRQDSVFIFFYYQFQGNGEPPDVGDKLSLWFKNDQGTWKQVWSVEYDTTKDRTKFVPVKLFVKDTCGSCFHKDFQFRFQNFARLSGPFDTWNLDYVYVNNGKSQYKPVRADFPDRAISSPITSVLKQYQSLPAKHLLAKKDTIFSTPSFIVTNQRRDQATLSTGQPITFDLKLSSVYRVNNVLIPETTAVDSIPAPDVYYGGPSTAKYRLLPNFHAGADSIVLKYFAKLNSGDQKNKRSVFVPTPPPGHFAFFDDYDTIVYKPIEFRYNDTTTAKFIFTDYYAYDDGIAEYAATLTQPGNNLAYQFDLMYNKPDTLIAVDIYFPHVGDESNQVVQLFVYDNQTLDVSNKTPVILTQQSLTINRTVNNNFTRIKLAEPVVVREKFFIGYKQNSNATIGVGLDLSSDSGNKIFTDIGTGWQPANLVGNLMIRAVFGNAEKAKGPITVVEEKKLFAHPNPNRGIFFLPAAAQNVQVVDVAGKQISFDQEEGFESTQVRLSNPIAGVYLVRYFNGTKWQTEKIMVLP